MPRMIKSAPGLPPAATRDTRDTVGIMLARLRTGGDDAARDYARRLDGWTGPIVNPRAAIEAAAARVPPELKEALAYAHANITAFAQAQRASLHDFETELRPGLIAGQRSIPVSAAGCYVPGGRYAHIASASPILGSTGAGLVMKPANIAAVFFRSSSASSYWSSRNSRTMAGAICGRPRIWPASMGR